MDERKYKWHYITSVIVVSIITIIGFACLSASYHSRLEKMAELQGQDSRRISFWLRSQAQEIDNLELQSLSEIFKDHESRMQDLMEMEFNKLQNDFNFISLWAGVITIVFLIFSIYSVFKTDEMLKKSEKAYDDIKGKSDLIENFSRNIRKKYQTELSNLKKGSDNYIKELSQKISLLDSRMASIDTLIKQANSSANDDIIQVSSEEEATQEPKE